MLVVGFHYSRLLKNSIHILFAILFTAASPAADRKPNVIVIFTDDHGWPDIGSAGVYDDLKTPHIDALAASGVRATSGYVTAPQCVPSRAGLLTGKSQNRFGVESNGKPLDGFDREQTIAERLKKAGYTTAQVGKWHLGSPQEIARHGFDFFYNKNRNAACFGNFDLDSGERTQTAQIPHKLYHLDDCSRAAVSFIRRHAGQPFFLYLAYRAPHVPLDAPKHHLDRFPGEMAERRRQALAMIAAMDDGVGAITTQLRASGIDKNTLVFFIGDNGAPLKIHMLDTPGGGPGWDGSLNRPMNGEKGMLSEGGIRVPFVVSWPGNIPGGQVYDHPVSSLDVAATAVALAGLPTDKALDGVNLIPFLNGERKEAPHEVLTWRWISQSAIRSGNWKLLRGAGREYLFDLESDPGESKNLLAAKPEIAQILREQLRTWSGELQPPGLSTKDTALAGSNFFDYYLDGKPAPPPRQKAQKADSVQGWIARNAKLEQRDGHLQISHSKGGRPFMVRNGLAITGAFRATIEVRAERPGKIGIAWREDGQDDFEPDQNVGKVIEASQKFQTVELEIPAGNETIHIRLHLPPGQTAVRSVEFSAGDKTRAWAFKR